jgi:3-hydroxymyristoyl/3-hydroxydecanoyl-(acyl carrier protein) dehydratase
MVAFSNEQRAHPNPAHLAQADMKFRNAICPPAAITLHSQLTRRMGNLCVFDVQATADGIVAADGTIVLSVRVESTPQEGTV